MADDVERRLKALENANHTLWRWMSDTCGTVGILVVIWVLLDVLGVLGWDVCGRAVIVTRGELERLGLVRIENGVAKKVE